MRACFLGQNVCALGFGVATLQTPRLEPELDNPLADEVRPETGPGWDRDKSIASAAVRAALADAALA